MTEAAAIRYILSRGWRMVEDGWYCLRGHCEQAVCVETAYHIQLKLERAKA